MQWCWFERRNLPVQHRPPLLVGESSAGESVAGESSPTGIALNKAQAPPLTSNTSAEFFAPNARQFTSTLRARLGTDSFGV